MRLLALLAGITLGITLTRLTATHGRHIIATMFSQGDNASAGLTCKRPTLGPVQP